MFDRDTTSCTAMHLDGDILLQTVRKWQSLPTYLDASFDEAWGIHPEKRVKIVTQ